MSRVRVPLFGSLPATGPWTPLGLGRGQFLGILALSLVLFVFVDGPVWAHVHDRHLPRIAASYAVVPITVAWALHHNGRAGATRIVVASGVIALLKLVLTAGMLIVLAL